MTSHSLYCTQQQPQTGMHLNPQGHLKRANGAEAIRQSILILLATLPGERVMRPQYGCDLFRLAFEPNDETTAGLAMHYVQEAVTRCEPRVIVEHVDAFPDPERSSVLHIILHYRLRQSGLAESLDYAFELTHQRPGAR